MIRLRTRRRARLLVQRGLRVARRHYLSVVSAGVVGAALAVVLTSSSFQLPADAPSEAAVLLADTPRPAATIAPLQPTPVPGPRSVVYYFVDSQETLNGLYAALHRDLVDEALIDYKPLHDVTRIFVLIEDHRDEAEALELIRQQTQLPLDDTIVRLVDMR